MLNIVMLVCGREKLTKQALDSLTANTQNPHYLTLVAETSKDHLMIHKQLMKRIDNQVIMNPQPGCTGAARNAGIKAAREKFGSDNLLYCSDNDTWFSPGWDHVLTTAYESAYRYGFRILGGGCHPFHHFNTRMEFSVAVNGQIYKVGALDALSGYSWLLSWDTWDKYGELLAVEKGVRKSEDWEYGARITKENLYIGSITPEVVVHCGLTDSFGQRPPGWELMAQRIPKGVIAE